MGEIRECIKYATRDKRYICQQAAALLVSSHRQTDPSEGLLTKTETEILRDIALGLTTKDIAEKRVSSFHTVNTHRKNIFRKLSVNNVHEATRYALRAGIVDEAEYYI
jgi:DNA-binding NarL/FixJ family response regulator